MNRNVATLRSLSGLITPGAWLLLVTWAVQQEELARLTLAPYARFFCFGALAGAALVSWYYSQGRVLFSALAAGLTIWAVATLPASAELSRLAAAFLLPLNIALFAFLSERGTLTLSGMLKMGLIATESAGAILLGGIRGGGLEAFLRWGQDPAGGIWLPLPQKLSFAAAAVALVSLAVIRRTRVEAWLFWALAAAYMGVRQTGKNDEPWFYFGAAGLMLAYAVLEHGYEIAHSDELTGLPGRRALTKVMLELGGRYAVAMCDVDHFKSFNDTFGHEAGDQVLRFIGSKLSQVGGGARAFRYGGEEFTLVFPGRSAEEAQPFVDSLREAIATSGFTLRAPGRQERKTKHAAGADVVVNITISIGVAENSEELSTPELVLEAADGALYRAKESGRNCVRLAADTVPA
jgi:diguanylate cyclase (GGDEF)-like protein